MCRLNLNLRISLVAFWQTNPLAKSLACLECWWCSYHPKGKSCWVLVYSALLVAQILQGLLLKSLLPARPFLVICLLAWRPGGCRLPMWMRRSSIMDGFYMVLLVSSLVILALCVSKKWTLSRTLSFLSLQVLVYCWTWFVITLNSRPLCILNCGML